MSEKTPVGGVSECFLIGIGECGSNLLGSYLKRAEKKSEGDTRVSLRIREYLIMNTDRSDLQKARKKYGIAPKRTLLFGNVNIGVGGKFKDSYNAVIESEELIINQLQQLGFEGINGFIIFTSLGGGTGCGGTPALIKLLRQREKEENRRIFIYVVGVLPFHDQTSEALNSVWSISTLIRQQMENIGPDLVLLMSNGTMLRRVIDWSEGEVSDFLERRIQDLDLNIFSKTSDRASSEPSTEEDFLELINPIALETIEHMLSPGIIEPGKEVYPTTDLADYSRRLDSIVVPVLLKDMALFPELGPIKNQFNTAIEYAVEECALVDMGNRPNAQSVYVVLSGPKEISKVQYSPFIKKSLKPFLSRGASISPSFVSYEGKTTECNMLLLFGIPKMPEIKNLVEEARALIRLHTGTTLKEHWFQKSKGSNREALETAVNDVIDLFGIQLGIETSDKP